MQKRIDTTRDANIGLVCGSSGSGKSWFVKNRIKSENRIIIFDPDDEYGDLKGIETAPDCMTLLKMLADHEHGNLKVRLVKQSKEAFNVWSKAAFAWGNCVAVAEEIAGRTSAGKAPEGWHTLVSRGRKRGIDIYGVTQRPSESDKTIIGNASWLHVGRLTRDADRTYMAKELSLDPSYLNLVEQQFIHKNVLTGSAVKGDMNNPNKRENL